MCYGGCINTLTICRYMVIVGVYQYYGTGAGTGKAKIQLGYVR